MSEVSRELIKRKLMAKMDKDLVEAPVDTPEENWEDGDEVAEELEAFEGEPTELTELQEMADSAMAVLNNYAHLEEIESDGANAFYEGTDFEDCPYVEDQEQAIWQGAYVEQKEKYDMAVVFLCAKKLLEAEEEAEMDEAYEMLQGAVASIDYADDIQIFMESL